MDNPFPPSDFDDWAETYDGSVSGGNFPFTGYTQALDRVVEWAEARPGKSVLDLGTGTGNLALLFARQSCDLYCTDFSATMLAKAALKLPQAHVIQADIRSGWPASLPTHFDSIVSAYVFHHFNLVEKIRIVSDLIDNHLVPAGQLVIADITFPDTASMEAMKQRLGSEWEDEYYWVADETINRLENIGLKVKYEQVSSCAGVFAFQR